MIITSGYFNPLHKGHIEYFHMARAHGDFLLVIINNDNQRELKGSTKFMDENERKLIVGELQIVDKAIISIDKDSTVIETLLKIKMKNHSSYDIFFANGGDQNNDSIPEADICKKNNIGLIDGLGHKIQSSSWILKNKK